MQFTQRTAHPRAERTPGSGLALLLGLGAFFLCGFAVTNMPQFLIGAALFAAVGLAGYGADGKNKDRGKPLGTQLPLARLIGPALGTALCFSMPPIAVGSGALWKYPMHETLTGLYHNVQPSALFPDFADDVISDYRFAYMPSIMQGTGHYAVRFVTDPASLEGYIDTFLPYMEASCLLSELGGDNRLPVSDTEEYTFWYDREFFAGCDDAGVIICEAGINPNHPHSTALIISRSTGKVQFSRLG